MNAGRELDALVSEKVMGMPHDAIYYQAQGREWITEQLPLYSTDIAEAWHVIDRMRWLGWGFEIKNNFDSNLYTVGFHSKYESVLHGAESAPMAICLAALDAIAIQVPS